MDARRYPRLTRYLRRLPSGLLSYPECEIKASIYLGAIDALPEKLDTADLDPLLASYIGERPPVTSWVPEVVNTAIYLCIADRLFDDDARFLAWVYDVAAETFRSPMYRFLMAVASPARLANGGERRWNAFRRGTQYEIEIGDNGSRVRVTFPPHLYDRLALDAVARSHAAAYHATGATRATYEVEQLTPTEAVFRSVWYPEKEDRPSAS